ncbi:MAG: PilC/PilY family type IV pilus protein, partial [Sulfuriferula sp.]
MLKIPKKNTLALAVTSSLMVIMGNVHAVTTPISISATPLYITVNVAPNIVVTLDDSGSMSQAFAPDSLSSLTSTKRFKAASFNPLYYNPNVVYSPPKKSNGSSYPNSAYSAAWINGFDSTRGTRNLSNTYVTTSYNPSSTSISVTGSQGPAYYYIYDPVAMAATCTTPSTTTDGCYKQYYVTSAEQQNFANWYSYYRTRNLAVSSGAMLAFAGLDSNVRVAWQGLLTCTTFGTNCVGWSSSQSTASRDNRIRVFTGAQKDNFYTWASRLPTYSTTPLRTAMKRAGDYYKTTGVASPYANIPQTTDAPEYSCRKNYHVMMTDGIWNDGITLTAPANADNATTTLPQSVLGISSYTPNAPFKDSNSSSLADYAFYYWANDLVPGLTNNVGQYIPDNTGTDIQKFYNAKNDPATWQHMVNFTVGLGLEDTLVSTTTNSGWYGDTYASNNINTDGYAALVGGTKTWPATSSNASPGNVYDLWHAALNSRGQFFSVDTPASIGTAFTSIVNTILASTPSAASLAANSTKLDTGTAIYQAKFNSTDWSGLLQAYQINTDGTVGALQWEASSLLPTASSRNLYTINNVSGTGLAFTTTNFASLSTSQQANLNTTLSGTTDTKGLDRVNWLRGDQTKELKNGGTFRNRTNVLGDIINSDPAFIQNTDFGYTSLPASALEASSYATFNATNASRIPMLYAGSNDGILHGFRADLTDANSGYEIFGFVPAAVYPNLSKLTDPAYSHGYYVDGAPTVGDAYVNGAWKTVLLGTLGGGGKSVFALDVTDPSAFNGTKVIGEYTDPDLGYTYSSVRIAKLHDGSWAAIFGNGYNSTAGKAYLFIVNLTTGVITKIATDATESNGLSTPTLLDVDNDKVTDYVYAGDLQGRVWKFDLTSSTPSSWGL